MLSSTRAELLRLVKWPVTWVTIGVWTVMNLFFANGLNYLTYRSAVSDGDVDCALSPGLATASTANTRSLALAVMSPPSREEDTETRPCRNRKEGFRATEP